VLCDEAGRTSAPNVWALGDVASWRDPTGHQARVEHWSNVADQARVVVPAMLGQDVAPVVVVPYFWSDQYDVKIQCLGEPEATDIVHLVEDDGRKFLAYYERDGVVVGVGRRRDARQGDESPRQKSPPLPLSRKCWAKTPCPGWRYSTTTPAWRSNWPTGRRSRVVLTSPFSTCISRRPTPSTRCILSR